MIDTYREGFNYITNYIMADTLSLMSLAEHLKQGHLFTAFKSLGDAKGFMYWSEDPDGKPNAITGDSINLSNAVSLNAVSPLPGQFKLIHDGKPVDTSPVTYRYKFDRIPGKGAYRIEIHIKTGNKIIPWLYTNPIYIY